jgi:hypothetical protein
MGRKGPPIGMARHRRFVRNVTSGRDRNAGQALTAQAPWKCPIGGHFRDFVHVKTHMI